MKRYKNDLTKANERTKPAPCRVCGKPGLVWRRTGLLCIDCDQASRPVVLTGEDIAAALTQEPPNKPVVTARTAIAALERSQGRKRP